MVTEVPVHWDMLIESLGMCWGGGISVWGLDVLSTQCCCYPKTILENKICGNETVGNPIKCEFQLQNQYLLRLTMTHIESVVCMHTEDTWVLLPFICLF